MILNIPDVKLITELFMQNITSQTSNVVAQQSVSNSIFDVLTVVKM